MSWLDNIKGRGVQAWSSERDREKEKEFRKQQFEQEAKKLRRPVLSLLKAFGKAYWGSVGRKYALSDGSYAGYLRIESSGDCFAVILERADDEHFFFKVISKGQVLETQDTSEEGLKAALSRAAEFGPFSC